MILGLYSLSDETLSYGLVSVWLKLSVEVKHKQTTCLKPFKFWGCFKKPNKLWCFTWNFKPYPSQHKSRGTIDPSLKRHLKNVSGWLVNCGLLLYFYWDFPTNQDRQIRQQNFSSASVDICTLRDNLAMSWISSFENGEIRKVVGFFITHPYTSMYKGLTFLYRGLIKVVTFIFKSHTAKTLCFQ